MSILSSTTIDHPAQLAEFSKGFAAVAVQYIAASQQEDAGKLSRWSRTLAGVGTGAMMTVMSLALLQLIGG